MAKRELITSYEKGLGASFATFTYEDGTLPTTKEGIPTLVKKDMKDVLKRIRANLEYKYGDKLPKFKTIYNGEMGDIYGRPHYHIAFIGLSDTLTYTAAKKAWQHGIIDVGCLTSGGIRYITDYMSKQKNIDTVSKIIMEQRDEQPPFLYHSINIGKEWILKNYEQILDNGYKWIINGKKQICPKYVLEWVSELTGVDYKPYVLKEMMKAGENWRELDLENALIREKWLIEAAKSKGIQISCAELQQRHWIKPRSRRNVWKPKIEDIL